MSDNPNAAALPPNGSLASIIQAVRNPLGLLTLVVLLAGGVVVKLNVPPEWQLAAFVAFIVVLMLVIGATTYLAVRVPDSVGAGRSPDSGAAARERIESIVEVQGRDVLYSNDELPPALDLWTRDLRPFLHQASHYSIPTYYLDMKLNVIDWNVAFALVFEELIGEIRGKHVNWFIARLANHDAVFEHARTFTRAVFDNKAFPYVDVETLEYRSKEYGVVTMFKVATQLTDDQGQGKGWAVALVPKQINWPLFEEKLSERIHADKRWSVYAAAYDRVLLRFPPYRELIQDVIAVVPQGNVSVADFGAGTGNVTQALVKRGHRVTAIEDNLGMLDGFAAKRFDREQVKLIKASLEHLDFIPSDNFDAVVMVNVLYAVDRPLECLRSICRVLRPNGVLGLSTTHRETTLDPLLGSIEAALKRSGSFAELASDWATVYKVNKSLEASVVRRYTRDNIREMLNLAGFEITRDVPSTYEGAVMLVHARKRASALPVAA